MDISKLTPGLWYTAGSNPWRWDPAYLFVNLSPEPGYVLFFLSGSDCIYYLEGEGSINRMIDVFVAPFDEAVLCHKVTGKDKPRYLKPWLPSEGDGMEDLDKLRSLFAERKAKAMANG